MINLTNHGWSLPIVLRQQFVEQNPNEFDFFERDVEREEIIIKQRINWGPYT